tara:strand:- start:21 stop:206 length:186 start_codon:yes stop_codon:yes gene_type:complete
VNVGLVDAENHLKPPNQTLRLDTMQGFRHLDKNGFMFNWVDISNNNRPNRPEGRPAGRRAL